MLPCELGWGIGAQTGWQLYGLWLAMGLRRSGRSVFIPAEQSDLAGLPRPLIPSVVEMGNLGDRTERRILIQGQGNHFPAPFNVPNRLHVAFGVFEDTHIPPDKLEGIKQFDHWIACSTWAQGILQEYGIASTVIYQGFDETLFHPAPRRRPDDGRFLVYVGGKLEFRKNQTGAIEMFKRFRALPEGKDAILVTALANKWPQTMDGIWLDGHLKGVPVTRLGVQDIRAWLAANGIPDDAHIDLGMLPQADLANAMRECDCALFPNRCEGATNMIAPEAMGVGLPCIFSANTGHLDVINGDRGTFCIPLLDQSPVTLRTGLFTGYTGWGESTIEEGVEALKTLRNLSLAQRQEMGFRAADQAMIRFGWHIQSRKFHGYLLTLE